MTTTLPLHTIFSFQAGGDKSAPNDPFTANEDRDLGNCSFAGDFILAASGSFDSGVLLVQFSVDGGATYVDSLLTLSANGFIAGKLPGSCLIRINLTLVDSAADIDLTLVQEYVGTSRP